MSSTATNATTPHYPPGYIPDYPRLVKWDSLPAAYIYMTLTLIMTFTTLRNLIFHAKTKHTKAVYIYLLFWCIFRFAAFAMRAYALSDNHGENYSTYTSTQIVLSIGFMPLAEVLTFNIAEASTLIYELGHRTYVRIRVLIMICFVTFGSCITAFVIDFTLNKPFGSNAKSFTTDVVLREVGFNGLFLIVVYTFFAGMRNAVAVGRTKHIPVEFVKRVRGMMWIVVGQSALMIVKMVYITYRNWNPSEFREEGWWYALSITPEYLYMLVFLTHGCLDVYDDVEGVLGEDGERKSDGTKSLEEGKKD
ncbi:hypothetical protein HDU79_010159, partial [Rhizoclosmatium sp. JEL0117]